MIELQTHHLQELYNEKLKNGRLDGRDGGLSPKSIRYIHTVIHSCLEQVREENKIVINPAAAAKPPKYQKPEIGYMNKEDIKQFLTHAKESKFFIAYLLALSTGMRRGEEAKQLVIEEHTNNNGTPQIVSIHVKWNAYIVEWENKENQEWGTDKVTKDGEVKMIEASIE